MAEAPPFGALGRLDYDAREDRLRCHCSALREGVEPHLEALRAWPVLHVLALGTLAEVQQAQGELAAARGRLEEAQAALRGCQDAGMLAAQVEELARGLGRLRQRPARLREPLNVAELRILRLLASELSQREIGRELYLSVNTVKSHTRAIYGKLDAASRPDAVARARALRLIA